MRNELTEQTSKDLYNAIDNIPVRKTLILTDCAEFFEGQRIKFGNKGAVIHYDSNGNIIDFYWNYIAREMYDMRII